MAEDLEEEDSETEDLVGEDTKTEDLDDEDSKTEDLDGKSSKTEDLDGEGSSDNGTGISGDDVMVPDDTIAPKQNHSTPDSLGNLGKPT